MSSDGVVVVVVVISVTWPWEDGEAVESAVRGSIRDHTICKYNMMQQ